ncbi:E3 ubiquitin-protein ligase RNF4-like [Hylaeus anthracinus]|uniref:E3 ubiquitin-protein ligase RNF4-like n=1 Tax=Hylaeus volcanicus TaxID=313075 RepID=UPI0023B83DFD|nr:E3 ubiquitin-protein ligase RNF4-like [Hylaeus volcanicus]XP_053990172.1 E3 ubiquitin-protein ligase RNF4-like [Hylaeus volcanicus]XP_053997345.1 E3 ubiquitin-protein ligase RNF4-like [Hylaeus anthracinus]XP_053997346.1 E3 ubiquitin-protein ligase RNF4-like [Hylaeus anthracinus]
MSNPIDYIDLTIDLPANKTLRLQNRNFENISNTNTALVRRRNRNSSKQSTQLNDSVIEIPSKDTCSTMEVINVDQIEPLKKFGICNANDSSLETLVALSCPICYEQYSTEIKPMSTRCGHVFCVQCLETALHTSKRCPTCKRSTKFQNCTRLYF